MCASPEGGFIICLAACITASGLIRFMLACIAFAFLLFFEEFFKYFIILSSFGIEGIQPSQHKSLIIKLC